ncbi:MAG TPA: CDP-alcohol phosphatidyltransferase family protein [Frankiaceae bacterium]|nr:CDP-alcohol phosphatidyltransferase family protein [Frankiaceae bacterium]
MTRTGPGSGPGRRAAGDTPNAGAAPAGAVPDLPGAAAVLPTTPGDPAVSDRVLTVPNVLSLLRLLGVPLFLWLLLGPEADGWAIFLLAVSGATDYVDGQIARRYGLISRVGQLLDPLADRLYILTTVLAFTIRGILPLYFTLILLARDLFLAALLPVLKRHGYGPLPVHFMGKAATYNLLFAFPLVLLGAGDGTAAAIGRAIGWAFATWGITLYWWAGALYAWQVRALVRQDAGGGRPPESPAGRDAEGALA